jgi:putative flippase GtrA
MRSKSLWSARMVKFLVTGGLGAACYLLLSIVLTMLGVVTWIASLMVYGTLVPLIYIMQKKFVFESDTPHSVAFPKYLAIQILGISVSGLLPFILGGFSVAPGTSFVAVVAFITVTNYILQSRWAFSSIE